jgi:hypothetical protein
MTDDTPKIASTLESARLVVPGLVFFESLLMWQRNHLVALAFMLAALALCLFRIRILSTQVSAAGVSQLTWRGRIQLRWDEVMAVTRKPRSIVLAGAGGSVVVPIDSFHDTAAAVQFINSHLPAQLRYE